MKKESWKKITLVLIIIGCLLLVFSAFPIMMDYTQTPLAKGYTTPSTININEWDMKAVKSQRMEVMSIDPDALDQAQEMMTGYIELQGLGHAMAQSVKNYREPLNGFYISIARHGWPSMAYFGIMYPSRGNPKNLNNFVITGQILPEQFPEGDTHYWVGLDLSSDPINIPPETEFYIVVIHFGSTAYGHWRIGGSIGNPYNRGVVSQWDREKWLPDMDQIDATFTTYTVSVDNGNGDVPSITITSSYQVAFQVLGLLSLVGAVISGVKYKWFL